MVKLKASKDVLISDDGHSKSDSDDDLQTELKCVVVGSSEVGKTALLKSYSANIFTTEYSPTLKDKMDVNLEIGKKLFYFEMADTSGEMDLDRLRIVSYPGSDIFLICFSVMLPNSFHDVEELWVPEVKHRNPGTPFFLVGTQIDLRDDEDAIEKLRKDKLSPVTTEMGTKMAHRVGAMTYKECSALTQEGVPALFDHVVLTALKSRKRQGQNGGIPCPCSIM